MLAMGTAEDSSNPVGEFLDTQPPVGLCNLRLLWIHLDSIPLSHELCLGRKQLMILTPASLPLCLTSPLWEPSQHLTSLERMRSLLLSLAMLASALDHQCYTIPGLLLSQQAATVGEVFQEFPRKVLPETGAAKQLRNQADFRHGSHGQFVREVPRWSCEAGAASAVDREGSPAYQATPSKPTDYPT